jgi:hypothetical protein
MSLKLNSSGGGSVTLQEPSTASNQTLTLPDNTGTLVSTASTFAGTGPAFRAFSTVSQSISGNIATKIQFNAETFDTNSCFDSTTNYRFTPNVAGYYQINALVYFQGSAGAYTVIQPYKNGSVYANVNTQRSNGNYNMVMWNDVVYFNGSTDYMEIYSYDNATCSTNTGSTASLFSGALVRAA